jgi:hypothetical protein
VTVHSSAIIRAGRRFCTRFPSSFVRAKCQTAQAIVRLAQPKMPAETSNGTSGRLNVRIRYLLAGAAASRDFDGTGVVALCRGLSSFRTWRGVVAVNYHRTSFKPSRAAHVWGKCMRSLSKLAIAFVVAAAAYGVLHPVGGNNGVRAIRTNDKMERRLIWQGDGQQDQNLKLLLAQKIFAGDGAVSARPGAPGDRSSSADGQGRPSS